MTRIKKYSFSNHAKAISVLDNLGYSLDRINVKNNTYKFRNKTGSVVMANRSGIIKCSIEIPYNLKKL